MTSKRSQMILKSQIILLDFQGARTNQSQNTAKELQKTNQLKARMKNRVRVKLTITKPKRAERQSSLRKQLRQRKTKCFRTLEIQFKMKKKSTKKVQTNKGTKSNNLKMRVRMTKAVETTNWQMQCTIIMNL